MNQKYIVKSSQSDRNQLEKMLASCSERARTLTRARTLLKSDASEAGAKWPYAQICEALDVTETTNSKVRKAYVKQGLEAAAKRKQSTREYVTRQDGKAEAHSVALACSTPPEGRDCWTLLLLQERLVELEVVESVSHETVRQTLRKRNQTLAEGAVVYPTQSQR